MTDLESAPPATASPGFERHVQTRTIVLPDHKLLFLPIPKAGCTSILWQLAGLAGLDPEDFARSTTPEASPALTVHDISIWPERNRLSEYSDDEQAAMLSDDDWLRFTIVRDPATRLWSAWQSKLLLREPRFVQTFGEEPWFPALAEDPDQVLADFRAFVAAVGAGGVEDVHWAVQRDLESQLSFNHVGRMESMDETIARLHEHVAGDERWNDDPQAENQTPLPLPPGVYDEATGAVLRERYGPDFDAYGYDLDAYVGAAEEGALERWASEVAPVLPVLRSIAGDHGRIEQLLGAARQLLRRVKTAEDDLVERDAQRFGVTRARGMKNREGNAEFNVRWGWAEGEMDHGFTAVLRVKNEARTLPYTLPPLLRATRKLVLVDNGSSDGTPGVARRVAEECGAADKLEIHHYPFSISRCGAEHLGTPGDSVHNLAYFYNWSFSHVRTTYALKWDGDMVLTDDMVEIFRDLEWQLEAGPGILIRVPRYPLYLSATEERAFLDTGLRNTEPWGWPNVPGYQFVKAMEWEMPVWDSNLQTLVLPDWGCIELKFLDDDEFGHWTDTEFERSSRQKRKQREFEVFQALNRGAVPPGDVVEIVAPAGESVVEHVRSVWLPQRARQELKLVV